MLRARCKEAQTARYNRLHLLLLFSLRDVGILVLLCLWYNPPGWCYSGTHCFPKKLLLSFSSFIFLLKPSWPWWFCFLCLPFANTQAKSHSSLKACLRHSLLSWPSFPNLPLPLIFTTQASQNKYSFFTLRIIAFILRTFYCILISFCFPILSYFSHHL